MFDSVGVVSESLISFVPSIVLNRCRRKIFVQPLGVNFDVFQKEDVELAQKKLGIKKGKYILFSDKSNTPLKRKDIAERIITHLDGFNLLVMCGVSPELVPNYLNSSEAVLITSDIEGSPNIVREALALNKRVFSFDVGDVCKQIEGLKNSCIISRNVLEAAYVIKEKLETEYTDNTRISLRNKLDMNKLTSGVIDIYVKLLSPMSK